MTQQKRLGLVLGLNLLMITGLVLVGLRSHSLSVLAAGGDYAADSTAILLGLLAIQISKHPRGYPKATTYVALLNSLGLLIITVIVMFGGIDRFAAHAQHIQGLPVFIVSVVATISMLLGAVILGKGAAKEDLHMRSVWLDTISDAVASAAVAISGLVIWITHRFYWLDSALAILIGLVIGYSATKLLLDVITALRTRTALEVD